MPSGTIQDIRALKIANEMPGMSADEIFAALPVIPPTVTTGFIYPHATANKGLEAPRYFKMEPSFFNELQEFKWHQIFNMTGAPVQLVTATGKDAKKAAEWKKYEKEIELRARIDGRMGSASSSSAPPRQ